MTIIVETRSITVGVAPIWMFMSRRRSTRTAVCSVSSRSPRPPPGSRAARLAVFVRQFVTNRGGGHRRLRRRPGPVPTRAGVAVIEVERPNRQARRRNGKSDTIDAIEAARAALGGRAQGVAKTGDGNVEAIRALLVSLRSGRDARVNWLNQLRHLGFTAPETFDCGSVSSRRGGRCDAAGFVPALTATRSRRHKLALRTLGRRVLDRPDSTASTASSAASSPRPHRASCVARCRPRHRGDAAGRGRRQPPTDQLRGRLGAPLRRRADPRRVRQDSRPPVEPRRQPPGQPCPVADRHHPHEQRPRTRRYVQRRQLQGLSGPEWVRVLKRYVAREVYRHLPGV